MVMRPLGRHSASRLKPRSPELYLREGGQSNSSTDVSAPSRTICSRGADGLAMASSIKEMPPSPSPVGSPNRQHVSPESESTESGIPSSASGVRLGAEVATFRSQNSRRRIRELPVSDRLVAIDVTFV